MPIEDIVIEGVAALAGIPQKIVADIEKDLPQFTRLARNAKLLSPIVAAAEPLVKQLMPKLQAIGDAPVKQALPMLAELAPIVDQLTPLYQQAMAIITPEEGDAATVAPVIAEIIDAFNKKNTNPLGGGVE